MLDPLEPVLVRLLEEWPEIKAPRVTEILRDDYGYVGSVDLVKKRLAQLRPRRGAAGAADGLSAGAGAAARLGRDADAAEGRRARAARLRADRELAVLGRADGALQLRSDGGVVSGGPRPRAWSGSAASRASASTTTCARSSRAATATRSPGTRGSSRCAATTRFTRRPARRRRRARRAQSRAPSGYLKTGFWPARRIAGLADLDEQYADWRDRVCNRRRHATGGFWVNERLEVERTRCGRCRRSLRLRRAAGRRGSPWTAISSSAAASTGRRSRWSTSASSCALTATASGSPTAARSHAQATPYGPSSCATGLSGRGVSVGTPNRTRRWGTPGTLTSATAAAAAVVAERTRRSDG